MIAVGEAGTGHPLQAHHYESKELKREPSNSLVNTTLVASFPGNQLAEEICRVQPKAKITQDYPFIWTTCLLDSLHKSSLRSQVLLTGPF